MAKKNSDTIFKEFLADLESINPAIKEILADEKVSTKLRDGVLARADYSSKMDEFRTSQESFATEVAEARQKIEGWQKWYGDTSTQVATIQKKLTQYEKTYGDLEDDNTGHAAKRMGVSKEELETVIEERNRARDVAALKFADDLTDIKIDYRDRFKEKLDTEAVYKIAGEKGIDLNTAYNLHIKDRVEELRNKDVEDRIQKARDEAVSEYASKHHLPTVDHRSDMTHVLDVQNPANTQQTRVAAALANFSKR